jgi:predicted dehydrogenase
MLMATAKLPIRVGVIGAGFIGPAHIESMRRLGYVEIAAISASSQASAERKAAALFVPKGYGNYLDLIHDPDIDVVDIAAPNILHYPAAIAALEAGKHVVCDKPLAMTSAESAELVEQAAQSGLVNAVLFNLRFYPLLQQARITIRRGDLGRIYSVHGGYWQDWLLHDTDYNWRVEAEQGGALRAVGDIGSHWLDLAQFITGLRVTRVLAELNTFLPVRHKPARPIETFSTAEVERVPVTMETEDAATVLLRLGDETRGTMQVSQVSGGRKNRPLIEVNGSEGSLCWDGERTNQLWLGHRDQPNEVLIKDPALMDREAASFARYPAGHDEGFADTHTAIQRAIFAYIKDGGRSSGREPNFPTFADGHWENVLGDCILQSARSQTWVDIPET